MKIIKAEIRIPAALSASIRPVGTLSSSFGENHAWPSYTGETEITPNNQTQTLLTAGTNVGADIVINPIPSNYGLITWNGVTLTVS